jgi:hypothetical protein
MKRARCLWPQRCVKRRVPPSDADSTYALNKLFGSKQTCLFRMEGALIPLVAFYLCNSVTSRSLARADRLYQSDPLDVSNGP